MEPTKSLFSLNSSLFSIFGLLQSIVIQFSQILEKFCKIKCSSSSDSDTTNDNILSSLKAFLLILVLIISLNSKIFSVLDLL